MSIGLAQEPSKSSKIKEGVDLAGLSLVSLLLNLSNSYKLEPSDFSLINKSTLVTHYPEDVMEDGIIGPCNTWPELESVPKPLTHIPPEPLDKPDHARPLLALKTLTPSMDTPPSQDYLDS